MEIFVGSAPHEPDLGGGMLTIKKTQPSPSIFTPQGLVFRDFLETFVRESDTTSRQVTIIRFNGKTVTYEFPSGSSLGAPIGAQATFPSRLRLLDNNGQPTSDMSQAATYERTFPGGAVIHYNVEEETAEALVTAGGREITPESRGVEVIREKLDGLDVIRQIKGSRAFVDVVTDSNDPYGYEIHLYAPGDVGTKNGTTGLYAPVGTAHTIWRIENPNQDDNEIDEVLVTKTSGTKSWEYHFEYASSAGDWSLRSGDPLGAYRVDRKTGYADAGWPNTVGAQRTVVREIFDGDPGVGDLLSEEAETEEVFAWGKAVVEVAQDPDGLNLVTAYDYYTNSAETGRYGRMKSIQYPDGRWVVYDYDSSGRKISAKRGWLDAAFDVPAAQARVTEYSYDPVDTSDVDYGVSLSQRAFPRRVRQVVETILGQEVSRTYHSRRLSNGERITIREMAAAPGAVFGATGNQRTTTTYYSDSAAADSAGRLKSVRHPDGREEFYEYALSGGELTIAQENRFDDGTGGYAAVANQSTRTERTLDDRGLEVERKVLVYTGSAFDTNTPINHTVFTYNDYTELAEQKRVDGTKEFVLYESTWTNGQRVSATDRYGVETTFTYNALEQVETSTKVGVGASGTYPAQPAIVTTHTTDSLNSTCGCLTQESRSITVNGVTMETVTEKDKAGRLLSRKDENGLVTSYSYANGGRTVTKILPSGATKVTEKYLDGQVKSVTGTAVVASYYTYGTNTDGSRYTLVTKGNATSDQWEKTTTDMLFRVIETERPAFGTQNHVVQMTYDDFGRMKEQSEPGKADTLFEYDAAGNLLRTGFKVDGAGSELVPASSDRITETDTAYAKESGDWFRVRATRVYATDASGTATDIAVVEERLSGFATGVLSETTRTDAHDNETVETVTVDRTAKLVTFRTDVPGSTIPAKRIIRNGLLQEENTSALASPVAYTYDAFGRRVETIDPRTGASEVAYREFSVDGQTYTGNLVETRDDPADNLTTYTYHESGAGAGQVSSQEDPDGKKTYFTYNLRGQQTHTWGSTYPVRYEYDSDFGWRTKQQTYRGGSDWFQPTWPTSPGTADTTTWRYQEKTGLLEAKEYADSKRTEYTYTTAGELASRTWARQVNGQDLVTTYTYWETAGGELKKVDYSDTTPDVEYTYTRNGQTETVTDAVGTRTFGYTTGLALETEEIDAGQNGLYSLLLTRKYEGTGTGELSGRAAGVSVGTSLDPDADYDTTWHYDSVGRFGRVEGPGLPGYGAEYGYLTDSHRVETVSYKTDSTTNVASSAYSPLADRDFVETVENVSGSTTVSNYDYGYNSIGQRESVENSGSAFSQAAHNEFDYNDRREVTKSERFEGTLANPGLEVAAQRREYAFDPIGNRTSLAESGQSAELYGSNALNQYTIAPDNGDFNYDADGNLVWHNDGFLELDYTWDAENRLTSASNLSGPLTADYTYDYRGRLVKAVFVTPVDPEEEFRYVWDDWNLLMVLDENNSPVRRFTWGLDIAERASGLERGARPGDTAGGVGGLLAVEEDSGTNAGDYIYFYDGNGNVGQVLDWNSESSVAHYEYDPFGKTVVSSGSYAMTNRFRFSTKHLDQITGFYYYGYRYYSPSTGRWLNRDPIGERGGRNLYGFVRNDPVNRLDFLGLKTCFDQAGFDACLARVAQETEDCLKAADIAKDSCLSAAATVRGVCEDACDYWFTPGGIPHNSCMYGCAAAAGTAEGICWTAYGSMAAGCGYAAAAKLALCATNATYTVDDCAPCDR